VRLPWRKREVDAIMVRFLDGPLEGRTMPVARKHLDTGVSWHEDGFAYGPHPLAPSLQAGRYNVHQVTVTRYRFEQRGSDWVALAGEHDLTGD
jgi:hypothetical protein